jgi:hypothetical protein
MIHHDSILLIPVSFFYHFFWGAFSPFLPFLTSPESHIQEASVLCSLQVKHPDAQKPSMILQPEVAMGLEMHQSPRH